MEKVLDVLWGMAQEAIWIVGGLFICLSVFILVALLVIVFRWLFYKLAEWM